MGITKLMEMMVNYMRMEKKEKEKYTREKEKMLCSSAKIDRGQQQRIIIINCSNVGVRIT
jgi:hypothetical protein